MLIIRAGAKEVRCKIINTCISFTLVYFLLLSIKHFHQLKVTTNSDEIERRKKRGTTKATNEMYKITYIQEEEK